MAKLYEKDPDAELDWIFNWSKRRWLKSDETIIDHDVIVTPAGMMVSTSSITDAGKTVTVWLTGGVEGERYDVTCRITTSAGRVEDKTVTILIKQH